MKRAPVVCDLLLNEEATADKILENLCTTEKTGEADILVVLLAGHGVKTSDGDYYFLGHNGTFDDPQSDGLNWRRLKECLSRTKCRATLFLDACHSGSIVNELTQGAQTPWLSRKELFGDLPIAIVE